MVKKEKNKSKKEDSEMKLDITPFPEILKHTKDILPLFNSSLKEDSNSCQFLIKGDSDFVLEVLDKICKN
jgi:hypothetical protein